jgi:Zn-finger nucleic acid-binding protein
MKCIKCDGHLDQVSIGPVTLDRCDLCGGVWFDPRELSRILAHLRAGGGTPIEERAATPHDDDHGNCPRCGGGLLHEPLLELEGIHLDRCEQGHGVWLDGGEVHKIAASGPASAEASFFTRR